MKKLLLLLAGSFAMASNAQDIKSVVFIPTVKNLPLITGRTITSQPRHSSNLSAKTTSTQSAWFSFQDAKASSSSNVELVYGIYNDTSLVIHPTTGTPFHNYIEGLGTSFDPTSTVFTPGGFLNSTPIYPQPAFGIDTSNAYRVDSFQIAGYYSRKPYNNYVDTLNIYVAVAPSTGVARFSYNYNAYFANTLQIPDGKFHFATPTYDSTTNSIPVSAVPSVIKLQRYLMLLLLQIQ